MTKKINLIAKGKNLVNTSIKERRILRAVESALDKANENIEICNEKSIEIVNKLSSQNSVDEYNSTINEFIKNSNDKEDWKKSKSAIEEFKKLLNEEIKEEDE